MSPSSVEMTCCCLRGFFLGEAPGGKSLGGIERLLANNARDGDTVLVVKGGTAERKGEEENPNHQQGKGNTLALFEHCLQAQLLFQNTVSSMDTPLYVCLILSQQQSLGQAYTLSFVMPQVPEHKEQEQRELSLSSFIF